MLLTACQKRISSDGSDIPVHLAQASGATVEKTLDDRKAAERKYTLLERELEYIMVIWPGEYDNVEQLDFDKFAGMPDVSHGQHLRVHHHAQRLKSSRLGEYVMYIEEYIHDDPSDIQRQSIYVLSPDEEAKEIKINVYHFNNAQARLSMKKEIDDLNQLTSSSSSLIRGCDMILRREGMAFRAVTEDKFCIVDNEEKGLSIDHQFRIAEREYWYEEIKYDNTTERRLSDEFQQAPYQLEKSRCFICMIDFPKKEGGRPTVTHHYIDIHDQGGKFEFDYLDGRHMILGMRNTWSFGMQRETFVIFIQEESQSGTTLIYSWGNPGADRIGFNPGWIRVQCDLDTPENRKFQQGLRPDS